MIRTIFGATVISLFIGVLTPLFPEPLVAQQTFMNVIIGGILCGVGIGMVFVHNGSTGGTDIIAAMASKSSNTSIGRTILYCDMCIISSSFLIFHNVDKVVYGFIVLVITAYLADMVIDTNRQAVQFTIFSRHWEKIADAISHEANRGCTVINGTGWYTKHEVTIFRIVKSIDEDAFITQTNVNGVYGKGFDKIKIKEARKHAAKDKEMQPEAVTQADAAAHDTAL